MSKDGTCGDKHVVRISSRGGGGTLARAHGITYQKPETPRIWPTIFWDFSRGLRVCVFSGSDFSRGLCVCVFSGSDFSRGLCVCVFSDSDLEEFSTERRYKPRDVTTLSTNTHFSPHEVKRIYRGFKVECPMGVVGEEDFKDIYSRFFPRQGKCVKHTLIAFSAHA